MAVQWGALRLYCNPQGVVRLAAHQTAGAGAPLLLETGVHYRSTRGTEAMRQNQLYWALVGVTAVMGAYYAVRAQSLFVACVCGVVLALACAKLMPRR